MKGRRPQRRSQRATRRHFAARAKLRLSVPLSRRLTEGADLCVRNTAVVSPDKNASQDVTW